MKVEDRTPRDWALVIMGERVRDFRSEEYDGRCRDFATRLDVLDDATADEVMDIMDSMVETAIQAVEDV